jgi:hypothetical protein
MYELNANDPLLPTAAMAKVESDLAKTEAILAKARADIAALEADFAAMQARRDRERRAAEASAVFRSAQR